MQFIGYSRNIKLFFWYNFAFNLGLSMFGLIYNLYVKALGYEQTMIGHIIGLTALASAIFLVPAGIMNDKFGPKRIASIGLVMIILTLSARSLITAEAGLLVFAFLGGMSIAMISATILPFMANNSSPQQRVHLFSFNMALVMFACVIGNVLGGLLSDIFQFSFGLNVVISLRITLLISVGIAALSIIPVLMFDLNRIESKTERSTFQWHSVWNNHKSSLQVIGLFIILGLLSSTAGGMVVPYLNVYFEDRFHASKTVIGIVVSLGQGATALAYLIGPMIARKLGEAKSVVYLQLSSIPFLMLTAYTNNFYLASGGYLFRQALMNASNPFYNSIKMKYVDRSLRGLAASSGEAVFNLGWFLAAPISTGLVAHYGSYYGYAYAFSITVVVYTIISILFHLFFSTNRFKFKEVDS